MSSLPLNYQPLADRMRPNNIDDFIGQHHIIGNGTILRRVLNTGSIPSMILWGPPGCGKTTLAYIIAHHAKANFISLSAVMSGVKNIRETVQAAKNLLSAGQQSIVFIDEIHRFNKAQQDALLPHVENGTIILIGATTENPSFEVIAPLLSRCRVFVLQQLTQDDISVLVRRALRVDKHLSKIQINDDALVFLSAMSNGDARIALGALELAAQVSQIIDKKIIKQSLQKSLSYDKNGEEHYNLISALHKSMRGSDHDAALYYLARMIAGGEDPLYIARRLIRFASEDIGLANSLALQQAVAAYNACHYIGLPECGVNLAQAVVYMAKSKKSNELYIAYGKAHADIHEYGNLPVPLHLRNAPTQLMKDLKYGKDYKYSPDHDYNEEQQYFPKRLSKRKYLS